jgi:hypothetical protein
LIKHRTINRSHSSKNWMDYGGELSDIMVLKNGLCLHDLALCVILILSLVLICNIMPTDIHGNGLKQENMVRSEDNASKAELFAGISPLLVNNGTSDSFSVKFQLYDIVNKIRYPNATYDTSIVKNEYSPTDKDRLILEGTFKTRNGFLTLNINNTNEEYTISKKWDMSPMVFQVDKDDRVNLTIPFAFESGQYHIRSEVSLLEGEQLSFDSIWQAGEVKSNSIIFDEQENNVTAISYYDRINNFTFDSNKRTIAWQIPFEYNSTRIDEGQVRIHEEIIMPNSLINSMNVSAFNMTMNNQTFDESLFVVDPYSIDNKTIIHYVPHVNALFELSVNEGAAKNNYLMDFVLYLT